MTHSPFLYTWSKQSRGAPMKLSSGHGLWLVDHAGEEWLDMGSLSYQAHLGFAHPDMTAALKSQVDALCMAPPNVDHPAKHQLADKLLAMAPPGYSKVFFTVGGAESVENALKIARLTTGRTDFVARERAYHGATMGALSVTGDYRRKPLEPLLPGIRRAKDCYCDRCPFGKTLDSCSRECVDDVMDRVDEQVAAVILEPVPGANGVLIPPPDYWPSVVDECHARGALVIADEVLTGFGRVGAGLAISQWGVTPDLITLAKGLTAGYAPLGAVLVHERIASHFDEHVLYAGLTSYGHPLGCAAGLTALRVYEQGDLYGAGARMQSTIESELGAIQGKLGNVIAPHVRAIGALGVIELQFDHERWDRILDALAAARVLVHAYPGRGIVVVAPALTATEDELAEGFGRLHNAVIGTA